MLLLFKGGSGSPSPWIRSFRFLFPVEGPSPPPCEPLPPWGRGKTVDGGAKGLFATAGPSLPLRKERGGGVLFPGGAGRGRGPREAPQRGSLPCSSGDAIPPPVSRGGRRQSPGRPSRLPSSFFRGRGGKGRATGLGDDTRTGVLPGVPGAQGAFEDWMARWFPRFASRIAFRCVLHPRESRDIRRQELFRGFLFLFCFFEKRCGPFLHPSSCGKGCKWGRAFSSVALAKKRKEARGSESLPPSSRFRRDALSGVCRGRTPPPLKGWGGGSHASRRGRAETLKIRFKDRAPPACFFYKGLYSIKSVNDPSAGSPTETLLRLLLPLNGKVHRLRPDLATRLPGSRTGRAPRVSPDHSIGRSDGRCVQRAGT